MAKAKHSTYFDSPLEIVGTINNYNKFAGRYIGQMDNFLWRKGLICPYLDGSIECLAS